jgi:hypothetical protein
MEIITPENNLEGWLPLTIIVIIISSIMLIVFFAFLMEEIQLSTVIGFLITLLFLGGSITCTVIFSQPNETNLSKQLYEQANKIYSIPITQKQSESLTKDQKDQLDDPEVLPSYAEFGRIDNVANMYNKIVAIKFILINGEYKLIYDDGTEVERKETGRK